MEFNIRQMSEDDAKQISKWSYEEAYSIYSMEETDDCINELLNSHYFSVSDREANLIGYFCFGESAQVPAGNQFDIYASRDVIDIGLGIKPALCGQGIGLNFIRSGLNFAQMKLSAERFRLTVAAFNKRAIKVYERLGFRKVNAFKRVTEHGETEFWVMLLSQ